MPSKNERIYFVEALRERGYIRRKCKKCGRYFWTVKEDAEVCGDRPCSTYTFIGNPPVKLSEHLNSLRERFLSFFERRGHVRVKRYPVVARWRDDVYLVGASIYDFQPWVTEGLIEPPANPLVISQPCIRLTDVDEVGVSGRHLTSFEMMAHHAFNFPGKEVYWNEETVELSLNFFTRELGLKEEEVNYIEDWWSGGGNAGEDFEVVVRGLEVATLVFMHYKVVNGKLEEMRNRIVDTGYGLERIYWLIKGEPTIYEAVFEGLCEKVKRIAGLSRLDNELLSDAFKMGGGCGEVEELARRYGYEVNHLNKSLEAYRALYRLLDHSKSLMLMLGDGVVPSNTGEGYLARLLIRRSLRDLSFLGGGLTLADLVKMQIEYWSAVFPEYREVSGEILEMIEMEEERYLRTLRKSKRLLMRKLKDLKRRGRKLPVEDLIVLYDSHGLPPELVKEEASKEGVMVEIPQNFYSLLAERHSSQPVEGKEAGLEEIYEMTEGVPPTSKLYYEDPYLPHCEARVLRVKGDYVILDRTVFYPEGGGQPADRGTILHSRGEAEVIDVRKAGDVVIHKIKGGRPKEGEVVKCIVDIRRRKKLMRAHTATHILLGAARRLLGRHVWQAGAQKGEEMSRLDITHYKHITKEELAKLEELANEVVMENRNVKASFMDRNVAEAKYGFTLYQGGIVPSRTIRVVEIEGWDAEACGGLHCRRTGEVGLIKVVKVDRIQDGVERIEFAVGEGALKYVQGLYFAAREASSLLNTTPKELPSKVRELLAREREFKKEIARLKMERLKIEAEKLLLNPLEAGGFKLLHSVYEGLSEEELIRLAAEALKTCPLGLAFLTNKREEGELDYVIMLGRGLLSKGFKALELLKELKEVCPLKGGGKDDMVRGILREDCLERAVSHIVRWLRSGIG